MIGKRGNMRYSSFALGQVLLAIGLGRGKHGLAASGNIY
jgi:hypothetical protein